MLAGCLHQPAGYHSRQNCRLQACSSMGRHFHVQGLPGSKRSFTHSRPEPLLEWTSCRTRCRSNPTQQRSRLVTQAKRGGSSDGIDYADRAIASLPYLVPLFDGLKYGMQQTHQALPEPSFSSPPAPHVARILSHGLELAGKFVFMQYPIFMRFLAPLDPLVRLYFGFPFARYYFQL